MKKLIAVLLSLLLFVSIAFAEDYPFGLASTMNKNQVIDKMSEIFGKLEQSKDSKNTYVINPEEYSFYGFLVNRVVVGIYNTDVNWHVDLYLTEENPKFYMDNFEKLYSSLIGLYGEPKEYSSTQYEVDLLGDKSYEVFNAETFEKAINSEYLRNYIFKWDNASLKVSLSNNFQRTTLSYFNY